GGEEHSESVGWQVVRQLSTGSAERRILPKGPVLREKCLTTAMAACRNLG
ncbi:unnamed protein product, partial [marine sediment metagenome]